MAKHKLQIFLDRIHRDPTASIRDKLIFNFIIRLGLATSEIINLKFSNIYISPDFFRVLVPNTRQDRATDIIIRKTQETFEFYDLLTVYYLERQKLKTSSDLFFLSQRLTPFARNVISKSLDRHSKDVNLGEYNTKTMRSSSLNLLTNYKISQVRIIERDELQNLEKEFLTTKLPIKIFKEPPKATLLDVEAEITKIKSLINSLSASEKIESPNIYLLSSPLGGGKTSLADFSENYAESKDILTINNSFYGKPSDFCVFSNIFKKIDSTQNLEGSIDVIYEKITRTIIDESSKKPLFLIFENIHLASPDSLEFLRYFLKSVSIKQESKILILLTIDNNEEHLSKLEKIEAQNFNTINLKGLSYNSIGILAKKYFRNQKLSDKLTENILGLSAGNPHYIKEALSFLYKNKKHLVKVKHNHIICSNWDVPATISNIERKKILYLNKFLKRILLVIAILEKPAELELILNIAHKLSVGKIDYRGAVNSLKRRKLICDFPQNKLYFYHETLKQAILDASTKEEKDKIRVCISNELKNYEERESAVDAGFHLAELGPSYFDSTILKNIADFLAKIGSAFFAIYYFEKALENSEISNKDKVEILDRVQDICAQISWWDKAIENAKTLESIQKHDKDKIQTLLNLGEIYLKKGDHESSLISLDKAQEIAQRQDDKNILAQVYLKIGFLFNKKANYLEAAKICNKGLALVKENGKVLSPSPPPLSPKGEGRKREPRVKSREIFELECGLLNELAQAYIYIRTFDKASLALDEALKIAHEINHKVLEINSLILFGMLFQFKGDFKEAISYYNESLKLSKTTHHKRFSGIALMNIGTCYHAQDNISETTQHFLDAKNIFDLMREEYLKTNMLSNLAIIHAFLGNFIKAYDFAKEALVLSQKNNYKIFIPSMEQTIGTIKQNLGDYVLAEEYFTTALHHLEDLADVNKQCITIFSQAECLLALNRFKEAKEKAALGLNLGLKENLKNIEYYGYLLNSQIEIESGSQKPEVVLSFLEKAKKLREEYTPLPDYVHKEKWLNSIYYKIGGEDNKSAQVIEELESDIKNYSKSLPENFKDTYVNSREKYLSLPPISKLTSKEEFMTELIDERNFSRGFSEILETLVSKRDSSAHLLKTLLNILKIRKAETAHVWKIVDGGLTRIISVNKEGKEIRENNLPMEIINYVFQNNMRISSSEKNINSIGIKENYWESFPVRSSENTVGIILLTFANEIPRLAQAEEAAFKNLLAIKGMILNKIIQDQEIIALNNEKDNALSKIKFIQEQKKEEAQAILPIKPIRYVTRKKFKYKYKEIIGESPELLKVLELLDRIIESEISILIAGESGTGKELIARAIHYNNPKRKDYPFLSINCAALPETLLESELFGYVKGAFTGAFSDKIGLFEAANNGTILLDEIGDMPLNLQAKLLRVLQDGQIRRVGDNKVVNTNVRVISSTNKNLEDQVKLGNFRKDLFYRLNAFSISMPSLRRRKKDINVLSDFFIKKHGGGRHFRVEKDVLQALKAYNWPGNIRELENEIIKLLALSKNYLISMDLIKDDARFKVNTN